MGCSRTVARGSGHTHEVITNTRENPECVNFFQGDTALLQKTAKMAVENLLSAIDMGSCLSQLSRGTAWDSWDKKRLGRVGQRDRLGLNIVFAVV